ncbi:MAG: hypothetical protein IPK82_24560 [Polyangiaceae bacterium]|nr:hypothetical protein [Polyangiaceae bacterium]
MIKNKTTFFAASVLGALAAAGCIDGTPAESDESQVDSGQEEELIAEAESGLASEMTINSNQRIVYAAGQYYSQPDVAVNQWAEGSTAVCNGVLIGPNVFLSAAHCGAGGPVTFRTYRDGGTAVSNTETFNCSYMIQTFNDTDASVHYCAPNAAGENPGDKYGYVDFDVNEPTVGQQVYSVSANLQATGSVPYDARMFANGQVTSVTGAGHWFTPSAAPNTGIEMNVWGESGMSGSPHFNASNHKMIIGPLSTASDVGWWGRNALSMRNYLYWGYVNPNYDPAQQGATVNIPTVQSVGLTPANYYGWADKNLDWEFDIQYDLERARGETQRDWYFLGFESQRRNALWDPIAFTSFDIGNRWARINRTSGTGYADALSHQKLNLAAGTYRVTLSTYTQSAAFASSLWVGFKSGGSYYGQYVPNTVGSGWQMHTISVTVPAGAQLMLGAYGTADILVSAPSIVKSTAVMNFDTHDKRTNWRNDVDGSRAQVVPDGTVTGTPNWAVRVTQSTGYPVRNRQLAMNAGTTYRICFDARRPNAAGNAQGQLRVVSGGTQVVSTTFYPSSAVWSNFCTSTFVPGSDDNNLQMRGISGDPFLVDNITITAL